jgi:WD40 repeat protein
MTHDDRPDGSDRARVPEQLSSRCDDAGRGTDAEAGPNEGPPEAICQVEATWPTQAADNPTHVPLPPSGDAPQVDVPTTRASPGPRQPFPQSPAAALGPPTLPGYEILGELGRGGMGVVYKARHLHLNRLVALKFINPNRFPNPDAVRRFHREAQAAARLSHPNVVTVYDAGQHEATHYLSLEYVEGASLAKLVLELGPLPPAVACEYIRQAAEGLHHAFQRRMVHRDLKPQNLMRTPDGRIKILDFGLARWVSDTETDESLTDSGVVMGTPDYMAPEQVRDAHRADIRADIYSLGCTLYHLLTGRPPFHAAAGTGKLAAHLEQVPQPLDLAGPTPAGLAQVVGRMIAKSPGQRYQTPAEVARTLAPFVTAAAGPPPAPGPRPRARRLPAAVALAALGAGLLLAGGLFQRLRAPEGPASVGRPPAAGGPAEPAASGPRWVQKRVGKVWGVAFSPDGKLALSGSGGRFDDQPPAGADSGLRLWEVATGQEVGHFTTGEEPVLCVAFSPDGQRAVSGGWNGTLRVWDVAGRSAIACFDQVHKGRVHGVALSPDGRQALSGSYDGTLCLWEVRTGTVLKRFAGHVGEVTHVALSADGRRALSGGGDQTVRLWDVATASELKRVRADTQFVTCVALSPDGRQALSAGRSVQLWDLETGAQVRRFEGHKDYVWRVVFSPDGRRALTSGRKTVRLWDVGTGKELARLEGHTDQVYCVAFSPDGRQALSASQDGTVRLWALPGDGAP